LLEGFEVVGAGFAGALGLDEATGAGLVLVGAGGVEATAGVEREAEGGASRLRPEEAGRLYWGGA
jgi:hypothetical protein